MINERAKEEQVINMFSEMNEENKKHIILEPSFQFFNQQLTLDYISKDDYLHLSNIFNAMNTSTQNLHTLDISLNKDESNEIDLLSLQTTLIEHIEGLAGQLAVSNKKLINGKDFENMYFYTEKQQGILRGKAKDPLPYIQTASRGNVLYEVKIVDKWVENYKKNMS